MKITLTGIKAWVAFIIVMAIGILMLIFILQLIFLIIPFVIVLGILFWFLKLFKKTAQKAKGTKKKNKDYVDVEFKIK